jgi:transcription termination factor Rho
MPVLDRSELEASPLADLHALANELGVDGYRLLRRDELIGAILGDAPQPSARGERSLEQPAGAGPARSRAPRGASRAGRGGEEEAEREPAAAPVRRERGSRAAGATTARGRARERASDEGGARTRAEGAERSRGEGGREGARGDARGSGERRVVEGVVELHEGGSAFLRVNPPGPSDEDLYISPAQVKRCELADGDRVSGPMRRARRSERHPSLARIDTINGVSADVAVTPPEAGAPAGRTRGGGRARAGGGASFEEGAPSFPSEPLTFGSPHDTLRQIERLAPLGFGARAVVTGASRSGKSDLLRLMLAALAARSDVALELVLVGVRPEEIPEWERGGVSPSAALTFTASADAQGQAVERALEKARRRAGKGERAVVLIDTLDGLHPQAARRALASARYVPGAGSLTVIATAVRPYGGETTVIALDSGLAGTPSAPALDVMATGTLRPELIVGEEGARAIAQARAQHAPSGRRLRLWRR